MQPGNPVSALPTYRSHQPFGPLILGLTLLILASLAGTGLAAAETGGSATNLVPPVAGQWLEISDNHFRFIFRERDRSYVDRLLAVSDEVHRTVAGLFAWAPPETVPVLIRGDQDAGAIGGLTSTFPLRIELVTSQQDPRVLLLHEFTHYVNATRPHGLAWFAGQLLGQDISFLGMGLQLHSLEGVTSLIDGERGSVWNEMLYRAPIIEGRMWGANEIWNGGSFRPGALRVYVSQYLFCDWLYRHYGAEVFTKIHDRYSLFPFLGDFEAIRFVTGMETERIWAAAIQELENRYAGDRSLTTGTPVSLQSSARQEGWNLMGATNRGILVKRTSLYHTTSLGFWIPPSDDPPASGPRLDKPAQSGEWFPLTGISGSALGVTADQGGLTVIVALPEQAAAQDLNRRLVSDLWRLEPQPSADGLAWQVSPRRLTQGMSLTNPVLSADGKRLFAIQRLSADYRLVEVDPQLGVVSLVLDLRGQADDPASRRSITEASLSPDGTTMALLIANGSQNDLATLPLPAVGKPADPADLHWITADTAHEYTPRWLPDGRLIFGSDRENRIWLYAADAGRITGLLRDPIGVWTGLPEASVYQRPNGSLTNLPELGRFLYQSYGPDGLRINRLPVDRLEQRSVPGVQQTEPDWLIQQRERIKAMQAISPAPKPTTNPGHPDSQVASSKPYADLALPRYWLPAISLDAGGWGAGLAVSGFSLLGIQNWSAQVLYLSSGDSAKSQLSGGFDYVLKLPDFGMRLHLAQDSPRFDQAAEPAAAWTQNRDLALGLNATVAQGTSPDGLTAQLQATLGADSTWTVANSAAFDLVEAWASTAAWDLMLNGGLAASLDWPHATAAFMGGSRLWTTLDGFYSPVHDDLSLRLALGGNLAISQSLLRLQARVAWSPLGRTARWLDNLGKAAWRIPDGVWRGDLQLAFDLPNPLLAGNRLNWLIPMEKTGTSLFLQTGATIDVLGKPAWDESVQFGLGTSFVPFLYYSELPMNAGVALRVQVADLATGEVFRSVNWRFWIGLAGQVWGW